MSERQLIAGAIGILVFLLVLIILSAPSSQPNAKFVAEQIFADKAICEKNDQRSVVVTEPSYFVHGGPGPKVVCVKK